MWFARSNGQRSKSYQAHQCWHTSCAISSERQGLWTSNLVHRWRRTARIGRRRHDLQGLRSRSQSHVIRLSRFGPCCICVIRGRWGHTMSAEPGTHTSCYYCYCYCALVLPFLLKRSKVHCVSNTVSDSRGCSPCPPLSFHSVPLLSPFLSWNWSGW